MTALSWDEVGTRFYETGVDRGVLYLTNGTGVAWNGLVAVDESADEAPTPLYLDGVKYSDVAKYTDFSANLQAFTYPDEFEAYGGQNIFGNGLFFDDQRPKPFDLCYRTKIGNDVDGIDHGYKLHLIYNCLVVPATQGFTTLADSPNLTAFSWAIKAVPVQLPGYRPTSHIIFDSREMLPGLMGYLESILYGTASATPTLPDLADLLVMLDLWDDVFIVDNGDGTWTATGDSHLIRMLDATTFEITSPGAVYLDAVTYTLTTYET